MKCSAQPQVSENIVDFKSPAFTMYTEYVEQQNSIAFV